MDTARAKLFGHGRCQAVWLPEEFRLPGTEVRVRRIGRAVLLEPIERDIKDVQAGVRGDRSADWRRVSARGAAGAAANASADLDL